MKSFLKLISIVFLLTSSSAHSQCIGWNPLQTIDSTFSNPAFGIATSPEIDKLNRPFVYLATVAGGLKIYNTNASGQPLLSATIPTSALGNLDVINLYQDSIWLYACLGNIWDTLEMAGLAIININNPAIPVVEDYYVHTGLPGGSGAVSVHGNYAYLAGNQNGLIILDISDKSNIVFKSSLLLSNVFPHSPVGLSSMYNARGIALKDSLAFICYDKGGLRIINISNVNAPVQINQYCYAPLINKATAYNNIVIHDNLAYVALDYYGVEILNISNPTSLVQVGWWHPSSWADTTNNYLVWSQSLGHANEIYFDTTCSKIYIAAGKSDAVSIDVSNPTTPITCETFGSPADDYGTWGLDYFNNNMAIAYIWSPAFPPYSNYTGLKVLQTSCSLTGVAENSTVEDLSIFPNPASDVVYINSKHQILESCLIYSADGRALRSIDTNVFSISDLPQGIYVVAIKTKQSFVFKKLVKQ
ncbi:MAG: T9SS type A sorting domain-containing protein [Bacteroidetes bacterium]|nr:T9SS type A sorting domain-containing protein [Bacteroidota bacterium]